MPAPNVDDLRSQLRERGYLTHGIERWFALDPWSSRTFWQELAMVAAKGAMLIALFAVLPLTAITLIRNHPLSALETLELTLLYGSAWSIGAFFYIALAGLAVKSRPELASDTPRALLGISFAASGLLTAVIAIWWYRFESPPPLLELMAGLALIGLFFVMSTVIISAALLSFSIYELQRVPAIHQKPRGKALSVAAVILIALLFIPAWVIQEHPAATVPLQIITAPTNRRVALVAVDGLTAGLLQSRTDLARMFTSAVAVPLIPGASTTERWASVGTGVPTSLHGVRAIEGLQLASGEHVLQALSRTDPILRRIAPALHLATARPLPPTVRRRDYVWELLSRRAISSTAVNWWTTESLKKGALDSIGQAAIFSTAAGDPLRVDAEASRQLLAETDARNPQFVTVYLPALDVVLNRLSLDSSRQLGISVKVLDGIAASVSALRQRNYDVVLIGLSGDNQPAEGVFASTIALKKPASAFDLAPTLCDLFGFPVSEEMAGHSLASDAPARIPTYGARAGGEHNSKVDEEYYKNLRSLGYVR